MISIIIPTLECKDNLDRLLLSIRNQSHAPLEILVVDGGSVDGTLEVAVKHEAYVVSVRGLGDTRTPAKNLGARLASGSILLFLDSDMELSPGVLQACDSKTAEGFEAVIIPETSVGGRTLSQMRNWEAAARGNDPLTQFSRLLSKRAFWSAGGFNELLSSYEDLDLQARLLRAGIQMGFIDRPVLHHEEGLTWLVYLKKQLKYTGNATKYRSGNPTESKAVHSVQRRIVQYIHGIRKMDDVLPFLLALAVRSAEMAGVLLGEISAWERRATRHIR